MSGDESDKLSQQVTLQCSRSLCSAGAISASRSFQHSSCSAVLKKSLKFWRDWRLQRFRLMTYPSVEQWAICPTIPCSLEEFPMCHLLFIHCTTSSVIKLYQRLCQLVYMQLWSSLCLKTCFCIYLKERFATLVCKLYLSSHFFFCCLVILPNDNFYTQTTLYLSLLHVLCMYNKSVASQDQHQVFSGSYVALVRKVHCCHTRKKTKTGQYNVKTWYWVLFLF